MSANDPLATRIEALEERIAHQDAMIEDLNTTVTEQWRVIESLKRGAAQMADRLTDLAAREPRGPEPPPPHY